MIHSVSIPYMNLAVKHNTTVTVLAWYFFNIKFQYFLEYLGFLLFLF